MDSISAIFDLFARLGTGRYGEDLSLELHMLQTAAMAQSLSAPPAIVAAALLHDIGYFLHAGAEADVGNGRDFAHEILGASWLAPTFPEAVTTPIALHVAAKRYLCAVEPGYFSGLSDMSRRTLILQGGIMNEDEVAAFAKDPAFESALILRRCDDGGKDVSLQSQPIACYRDLLISCLRQPA